MMAGLMLTGMTAANAGWVGQLFGFQQADHCKVMNNSHWTGSGTAKNSAMTCNYEGTGDVTGSAPNYAIKLRLTKSGGSMLCALNTIDETLKGTCVNNEIKVNETHVSLDGKLESEHQVELTGKLSIAGVTYHVNANATR
ncbi:MAG: hypothetical protein A3F14_05315 [Gammaproteobacteria bacterium RIFCSPHIGHO2_12_FULL_43_28]|nr:MAG: hypothetical protein A3F14_05315 [Gammaproteobacteria bacterium RIFCSPHIGHO2_12_FULL_43_28]